MSVWKSWLRSLAPFAFVIAVALTPAQRWAWGGGTARFVGRPEEIVERMLCFAEIDPGDRLLDFGLIDGRIVIRAT